MSTDPDYACSLNSFDSTNINVVVEGNQYTIHRFFLARDSPMLCEKFSTPVGNGNAAYTLEGITKEELEHLLWVYYNPQIEHYLAPIAVWRDALKLADMWKMDRIKHIALRHLLRAELDLIEKIQLCEHDGLGVGRYDARDAYIKICTREESLTPAEFQALGMELVLLVMQIRERILASRRDQPEVNIGNIVDNAIGVWEPGIHYVPDPSYC
ncbi:hypothetical protein DFH06DRAFT_1187639 [Mycena polygramma]|nr:hypothetical protein DFH06DRAFT_1187639 [Mycena polygramma]